MPTNAPAPTCIYCGGPGPFSDEHVIPASIGADDRGWLLKGCVCRACNTGVFSPLELKFARSSPFYLSRLALQPRARNRGSGTKPPRAKVRESLYFEPEINCILEAVIRGGLVGLAPTCLPQIHLLPDPAGKVMFEITGPDTDAVTRFLADLQAILRDRVALVEKRDQPANARFTVNWLRRVGDRYCIETSSEEERPPPNALWYAPLAPVRSYAENLGATVTPRVFRHESGSLTCRSDDIATTVRILGILAQEVGGWSVPAGTPIHSTPAPAYRQILDFDHDAFHRVLAKIGLNVIAKTSGLDVMRRREFNLARAYVLHGKPRLLMRPGREDQIPDALGPLANARHLIGIVVEHRAGMEAVRAVFRLYGGPVHQIRLAGACGKSLGVKPVWLSVDYVHHRVEEH